MSELPRSVVAVEPVEGDVRGAIRRALDAVSWRLVIPRGADISLKVNLGWDLFIPGSITSPLVAESLILELRDHVGKIYMVEADQVLEDIESAFRRSGMAAVCERTGVEWVNMERGPTVAVPRPDNVVLREVHVPQILRDTLLVTVPVMKTHAKTGITGALKNQWGCLSKMRHEYHLVLTDALADLNQVVRPVLSVMDGTVGLEGNGPKSGTPRVADRILCSTDPVALDTVQAICMGIDPATVPHLRRCAERGIGTDDRTRIDVRGLVPEEHVVRFRPARDNTVSLVENVLRKSALKRLFFNTPIFRLCLAGAKLYYRAWVALNAERHWRRIRAHAVYGPQWRPGWPGVDPSVAPGSTGPRSPRT
ncbi:MAG: DUF362 domain-containing protein [Acidobacteria bacterium]|nr:DUF362 domain-containing protein [Acidobacteriota bacterium]